MKAALFVALALVLTFGTARAQVPDSITLDYLIKLGKQVTDSLNSGTLIPADKSDQDDGDDTTSQEMTLEEIVAHPSDVSVLFIDLTKHPLSKLPDGFSELSDLTFLVICHQPKGSTFDWDDALEQISKLEGIEDLYIIGNGKGLVRLPASIGKLRNLRHLALYWNAIQVIPEEIGNLTLLEDCLLDKNNIRTLPRSIAKLDRLKSLDISKNELSATEITQISKLLPHTTITSK
jgi:hypothetical protein